MDAFYDRVEGDDYAPDNEFWERSEACRWEAADTEPPVSPAEYEASLEPDGGWRITPTRPEAGPPREPDGGPGRGSGRG